MKIELDPSVVKLAEGERLIILLTVLDGYMIDQEGLGDYRQEILGELERVGISSERVAVIFQEGFKPPQFVTAPIE